METFMHCWWELLQQLWKKVWRFIKKLKIELPYGSASPFLDIYPNKTKTVTLKDLHTPMFFAALSTHFPFPVQLSVHFSTPLKWDLQPSHPQGSLFSSSPTSLQSSPESSLEERVVQDSVLCPQKGVKIHSGTLLNLETVIQREGQHKEKNVY